MDRRPASGKRVLLVEDRPEGLSVLRAALGERGFEVLEARNADEALELARKEPPDLAVIAVLTAVTDGCRLLRLWKSDPGLKAIPLVVVSSSCADPQVALGLGADAFLSGPAQLLDLLDRLGARTGPLAAALQPVIPCESCLALVHRLEDRIAQLELANRDLRDRQARLTASERRFRGMIERSSDVVVLLDADGTMRYRSDSGQRIFGFEDDEVLEFDGWVLRAVWTPGHTPGHLCLYEPNHRLTFTGDHVLSRITPNCSLGSEDEEIGRHPLIEFRASQQKVADLDTRLGLPAHEDVIEDLPGRCRYLMQHHDVRADEVMAGMGDTPPTALEIASRVTWNKPWSTFGIHKRRSALGETLAHLDLLEQQGRVRRHTDDYGNIRWERTGR